VLLTSAKTKIVESTAAMAQYTSDPASFPSPVDLSHHLSRSTKAREASSIKQFYKYFTIPGIAQLAGGMTRHHVSLHLI
jgi:site-specific recombinase XerD